jgi:hypothetical protein
MFFGKGKNKGREGKGKGRELVYVNVLEKIQFGQAHVGNY